MLIRIYPKHYHKKSLASVEELNAKSKHLSPEVWNHLQNKLEKIGGFQDYAELLMDQVQRRILEDEVIPHEKIADVACRIVEAMKSKNENKETTLSSMKKTLELELDTLSKDPSFFLCDNPYEYITRVVWSIFSLSYF